MTPGLRNTRQLIASIRQAWRPRPEFTGTIEQQIARNNAVIRQAQDRLTEVLRQRQDVRTVEQLAEYLGLNQDVPATPIVSTERPETRTKQNVTVKEVARWISNPDVPAVMDLVVETTSWIYDFHPYLVSFLDPPKTLDELRAGARLRRTGYERHHVAEQAAARDYGIPEADIHGEMNLVAVPTLKHWLITGWFAKPSRRFDGKSPREYLSDKAWDERQDIGFEALVEFGVLKQ